MIPMWSFHKTMNRCEGVFNTGRTLHGGAAPFCDANSGDWRSNTSYRFGLVKHHSDDKTKSSGGPMATIC